VGGGGAGAPGRAAGARRQLPACAACLAAARLLADGGTLRREAPVWLAARVGQRLARLPAREAGPRARCWRLASSGLRWAAVPLAAVLAAALTFGLTTHLLRPARVVTVRLMLAAPGAASVSVVGDWNGWDPERNRLRDPDGDGVWEIRLRLRRGQEARYQFLVDGERWLDDPQAPLRVDDGFGGTSSVLQI
jgi:hypothetical protein